MAENDGRRSVVNDPLAVTGREVRPDRSLALSGVRSPNNGGPSGGGAAAQMADAFGALGGAYADFIDKSKDKWITEGKMAYMAGKTEAELLANGNRFTQQGFLQLKVRDDVNNWYMGEAAGIDEARNRMSPDDYQAYLKERRASFLEGVTDPYAQKVAVAAFEQFSPQLVQSQFAKNNEFERNQRINAFGEVLSSTAATSSTASQASADAPLALSTTPVLPVLQPSAMDRDVAIRTMLGEAANEGTMGLAAVAHVIMNRSLDPRWPSSIRGVAQQPQQFSAWNSGAGGNNLVRTYGPGNPIYEKAGAIFDAVMSGRHVDPTNGATHYYSPAGMSALVKQGAQSNAIPGWLADTMAESGGSVQIGGHIFTGKANIQNAPRMSVAPIGPDGQPIDIMANLAAQSATPGMSYAAQEGSPLLSQTNAVAAEESVDVTGVVQSGTQNEVQELIRGYNGLNANDKAAAVAAKMAADLANGDNTFFRDGGGVGMLLELGATPEQVQSVRNAEAAYNAKQLDTYDAADEAWRSDVLERAGTGTSLETLLGEIDKRVQSKQISDQEAQSLARSAAEKVRNAGTGVDIDGNIPAMTEVGGLYQQITAGGLDFESAGAQAKAIGEKYGLKADDVNQIIGQMFSLDQQRQNAIRADAQQAAVKYQTNEQRKAEVNAALGRGVGLNLVEGNIETVNAAGQKTSVSAQEFGIAQIRNKHLEAWRARAEKGEISTGEAVAGALRATYLELQKQQVVDKETQAQLVGALTGSIAGADGNLNEDALQAYDTWLILRNTPEIKSGYLAQMVGDDYVRGLLETAYVLEGGNLTGGRALRRAHEIVNDPLRDAEERISKDAVWQIKLKKGVTDIVDGKSKPGFFEGMFGAKTPDGEFHRALQSKQRAMTFVTQRAEAIHMNNPQQDAQVSLELALQDLQNSSTVVAGNLILTPGKPLSEAMGISQFGVDAPDEAITKYLQQYGSDIWGVEYDTRKQSLISFGLEKSMNNMGNPMGGLFNAMDMPEDPPVYITYNEASGILTVDLYKDEEKGILLGMPRHLQVGAVGQEYFKGQTTTNAWDDMWNGIFATARPAEAK